MGKDVKLRHSAHLCQYETVKQPPATSGTHPSSKLSPYPGDLGLPNPTDRSTWVISNPPGGQPWCKTSGLDHYRFSGPGFIASGAIKSLEKPFGCACTTPGCMSTQLTGVLHHADTSGGYRVSVIDPRRPFLLPDMQLNDVWKTTCAEIERVLNDVEPSPENAPSDAIPDLRNVLAALKERYSDPDTQATLSQLRDVLGIPLFIAVWDGTDEDCGGAGSDDGRGQDVDSAAHRIAAYLGVHVQQRLDSEMQARERDELQEKMGMTSLGERP